MLFRVSVALTFAAVSAFSQGTTSRLQGTVQDSSGAVVAAANVSLTNEGTNITFQTRSTEAGTYVFEALQSGRYTLAVEATGFKKFSAKNSVDRKSVV